MMITPNTTGTYNNYSRFGNGPMQRTYSTENMDRVERSRCGKHECFVRTLEINYWPKAAIEAVSEASTHQMVNNMCNSTVQFFVKGKHYAVNERVPFGECPLYIEFCGPNWEDAECARRHIEEVGDYIIKSQQ